MARQRSQAEREMLLGIRYQFVTREEVVAMGGISDDDWLDAYDDPKRIEEFEAAMIALAIIGPIVANRLLKLVQSGYFREVVN